MRLGVLLAFVLASCGGGGGPSAKFQITFLAVPDDCFGGNQFEVRFEGSEGLDTVARTECVAGDGALFSEDLPLDTYILTATVLTPTGQEVCRHSPRTEELFFDAEVVQLDFLSWPTSCY